jgi:FkbM family methyltransferase
LIGADVKDFIRKVLFSLGLDITANQKMDRLTYLVFRRHLRPDSVAVDIGCHKGEVLEWMFRFAPEGVHFAFEPIPPLFERLQSRFAGSNCHFFSTALSDHSGEVDFVYVPEAPAYSGLRERDYGGKKVHPQTIRVHVKPLDEVIPEEVVIDLIKIDVEGAEMQVLRGAEKTIRRCRPLIVFEFGRGASDRYGTTPAEVFQFFTGLGMSLFSLRSFERGGEALSLADLQADFDSGDNYYFVAR